MANSILDVLERHGINTRQTGKLSEFIIQCPVCAKFKLYVNIEKRMWVCYVCADGGYVSKLFKLFSIDFREEFKTDYDSLRKKAEADFAQRTGQVIEEEVKHALPEEYKPLVPGAHLLHVGQAVYDYLRNRGVTDEQILAWKLGYCVNGEYGGCCIIPVTAENGEVVTFQGRRVVGVGQKSMNPMGSGGFMFNCEFALGHTGVVIVEGPFDAIAVHSKLVETLDTSSLALLRHSISNEQAAYIGRVHKPLMTWVALDPDVDENYMHKVGGVLRANGCAEVRVALLPKDPDELSFEELAACLDAAEPARVLRKPCR